MRGEATYPTTYSETIKRSEKRKQRYVDHLRDILKLTCLINEPVHSPDECKVLNDLDSKYTEVRTSKERRKDTVFNIFLENRNMKNIWSNMQLMKQYSKKKKN